MLCECYVCVCECVHNVSESREVEHSGLGKYTHPRSFKRSNSVNVWLQHSKQNINNIMVSKFLGEKTSSRSV